MLSCAERVNGVGFLAALIDELVEERSVEPEAVFIVGVSDGAMMAHRFACERTDEVAAFTAVIGAMPYRVARRRSRCGKEPLSVLMINGTEDPIVPPDGGVVEFDGQKLELFEVQGAGHTWPSGWQYLPESLIGATSRDIDASIAAWRFFQSTL